MRKLLYNATYDTQKINILNNGDNGGFGVLPHSIMEEQKIKTLGKFRINKNFEYSKHNVNNKEYEKRLIFDFISKEMTIGDKKMLLAACYSFYSFYPEIILFTISQKMKDIKEITIPVNHREFIKVVGFEKTKEDKEPLPIDKISYIHIKNNTDEKRDFCIEDVSDLTHYNSLNDFKIITENVSNIKVKNIRVLSPNIYQLSEEIRLKNPKNVSLEFSARDWVDSMQVSILGVDINVKLEDLKTFKTSILPQTELILIFSEQNLEKGKLIFLSNKELELLEKVKKDTNNK